MTIPIIENLTANTAEFNTGTTSETITTYAQLAAVAPTRIYVSLSGNDATANGSIGKPFATIAAANAYITTNSISNPFEVYCLTGVYAESDFAPKPYVTYEFNNSQVEITNLIGLDPSWNSITNATLSMQNVTLIPLAGVILDFNIAASQDVAVNLLNFKVLTYTPLFSINGYTGGGRNSLNISNYKADVSPVGNVPPLNISDFDCIANNVFCGIFLLQKTSSSNTNLNVCYLSDIKTYDQSSDFTLSNASTDTFTINLLSSYKFSPIYISLSSGALVVNERAGIETKPVELNGNVTWNVDTITNNPTLVNSATFTPTVYASGMLVTYSPVNYSPADSSVQGNFQGIDSALGSVLGGVTYTAYNAATNTPSLASLGVGDAYIVTTAGRVSGIQVTGATVGSDSFLCVNDIIDKTGTSTYNLRDTTITSAPATIKIGTLNNASNIYFINFDQAITYFNQRRLIKTAPIVVTVDSTYDGVSYANPDSGTLNFSHPDYNYLEYRGNFTEVNATANTSNSGILTNQTCNYTTTANTFTVNKYVQIYDETTSNLVATNFLGAHSGTFLLTAATSTSISVNNTNSMRTVIDTGGDANFSTTKVRQCTNITARLTGTGLPKMQNLIFVDNTNAPILNISGDWCIDGVIGFGCAGSSTRSSFTANLDAVNIYAGTFPTTGSVTQPINGILSISGRTSNFAAQIAAYNANIVVGQIIMSSSSLNTFNNSQVAANKIYGGLTVNNNSLMSAVTQYAGNNVSGPVLLINNGGFRCADSITNSNANGITVNGGSIVIFGSQYASRNLTSGNILNSGSIFVNAQENISTNSNAGNLINAGNFVVNTQNVVTGNNFGNRLITGTFTVNVSQTNVINNTTADNCVAGAGSMAIFGQNNPATTAPTHNLISSDVGGIQIFSGSSTASGFVTVTGYGYFMKTNGSNPTKVINPIIATATAGGAIPSYESNVSMTAIDASGAALVFTTTYFKRSRVGNVITINASIVFPVTGNAANAAITATGLPTPAQNETQGNARVVPNITTIIVGTTVNVPISAALSGNNVIFYNLDNTRLINAQLSNRTLWFTITYIV